MPTFAGKPPTKEIGHETVQTTGLSDMAFVDWDEYAPDLIWPSSIYEYRKMLNDAQISGLLRGLTQPIRKYRWYIDPNGARPDVYNKLATDFGLPLKDDKPDSKPVPRRKGRFIHDHHLSYALKALAYGHYYFEKVGTIGDDGKWHLTKLAPRTPFTIATININKDGSLKDVTQFFGNPVPEPIPAESLAVYLWDQDPGNWVGRSLLRAVYRNWIIKDSLLRVDAIKHQRSGMGIPIAEAPENASEEQVRDLDALMQNMRVFEEGGAAVPAGTKLQLMGTTGNVPNTIESVKFHNEEMARAFVMMFMQLGQTQTGSRALGREFIDFFGPNQMFVADWYCDVTNEFVIEDWVDWNYGEDEQPPIIGYQKIGDENLEVADLVQLVESGAVVMDDVLYEAIRERYKLPDPDPATAVPSQTNGTGGAGPPDPQSPEGQSQRSAPTQASAGDTPSPLLLPDRPLRRQPYDHEVRASVDYASIDANLSGAVDLLIGEIGVLQRQQIDELHDQIIAAGGDLKALAQIQASPVAQEAILASMQRLSQMGAKDAVGEATRQGKQVQSPKLDNVEKALASRSQAVDEYLARTLSDAAVRHAMRRTAPGVASSAVAEQVKTTLSKSGNKFLRDQMNGALTQAMNSGRKAVFQISDPKQMYASELLDENTCEECMQVDGTEYPDLAAAEADYPTGGYVDCLGLEKCRGTIVAVYDETPASVA